MNINQKINYALSGLIILLGLLMVMHVFDTEIVYGFGEVAPTAPKQTETKEDAFHFKGFKMMPLANYDITARILDKERYYMDKGSDLSPIDLVLGWGLMSDEKVLRDIKISQYGRWYYMKTKAGLNMRNLGFHSANVHIIPKDKSIKKTILNLPKGSVVRMKGKLVRAYRQEDGFLWTSSLSRRDSGDGACEVFYVESISIEN